MSQAKKFHASRHVSPVHPVAGAIDIAPPFMSRPSVLTFRTFTDDL
jgi:hypothetical protein